MDKFCEFYDAVKDDQESYLLLYDQLKSENLTVRDALEGLQYARWLASMKFEYGNLQIRLQQLKEESFHVWQSLQGLKQEKFLISNELHSLKATTNTYSNEEYLAVSAKEDVQFVGRRRRRRHR